MELLEGIASAASRLIGPGSIGQQSPGKPSIAVHEERETRSPSRRAAPAPVPRNRGPAPDPPCRAREQHRPMRSRSDVVSHESHQKHGQQTNAPPIPSRQRSSQITSPESEIESLMNMGFTRDIAVVAWQACRGDMNMAVEAAVVLTSSASPNKTTTPTHARPPQELPGSGTSTNSSGSSGGSSRRPISWPDHEQGRPHGNGQEEAKMCPRVSLQGLSMAEDAQRSSSLRDDVSLSWKWLAQAPLATADDLPLNTSLEEGASGRGGGSGEGASPARVSNWMLANSNEREEDDAASPARVSNWMLSDISNETGGASPSIPMVYRGSAPEQGVGGERIAQVPFFKTPHRSNAGEGTSSNDASPPIPLALSSSSSSSASDGSGRRLFDPMTTHVEQRPDGENVAGGVSKTHCRHEERSMQQLTTTTKTSRSVETKSGSSTRSDHINEATRNCSERGAVPPLVVDKQSNPGPSSSSSSKGTRPYLYASAGQQKPIRDTSSSMAATAAAETRSDPAHSTPSPPRPVPPTATPNPTSLSPSDHGSKPSEGVRSSHSATNTADKATPSTRRCAVDGSKDNGKCNDNHKNEFSTPTKPRGRASVEPESTLSRPSPGSGRKRGPLSKSPQKAVWVGEAWMGLGMQVTKKDGVGIIISAARPGGVVARAEPYLRVGDRIISINSKPVKTVADVTNLAKGESGFEVQLHCSRVSQGKGRFVSLISLFRDMPGHHKVRLYAKAKRSGEGGGGEIGGVEADVIEKQTLFSSSRHVPKPSTYVEKISDSGGEQVAAAVGRGQIADEKQTAANVATAVAAAVAAAQAHATEKDTNVENSTDGGGGGGGGGGEGGKDGGEEGEAEAGQQEGRGTDVRLSPPPAKKTGTGLKCRRRLAPSSASFTAASTGKSPSTSAPLAEAISSDSTANQGSMNASTTCASKAGPTSRGSTSEAITVSTNVIAGLQISDSSDTSPRSPTTSTATSAVTSAVVTYSSPGLTRPIDAATPSLNIPLDVGGAENGRAVPAADEVTVGKAIKSTHSEDSASDCLPFGELDLMWPPMGTGSCKTVYQAYWNGNCVAAAKLREGDGRSELALLRLLRDKLPSHPHIPVFHGVSSDAGTGTTWFISEFFPLGGLDTQLEVWDGLLSNEVKLCIGLQIINCLSSLGELGIVHRDIASRNVLVHSLHANCTRSVWVKVTDFGSAIAAGQEAPADEEIPWRYVSPEVEGSRRWGEGSDVWAYGVTLWEIFSGAQIPYCHISDDAELRDAVFNKGLRLKRPRGCPEWIYSLMSQCWEHDWRKRVSFRALQANMIEASAFLGFDANDGEVTYLL